MRPSGIFLFALVAVTAIGPLSMLIFLPALPSIQAHFVVAPGTAQLALSISMLSIAVATLAYGPLSDRYGRRPVLIGGLWLFLVGSLLCMIASNVWVLILGRILQAAGGASGMVLARAIVCDVYAREKAASVIAYLTMAMVVVPMLAPAMGGVLIDLVSWRANFAFAGIAGIFVLGLVLLRLAETNHQPRRRHGSFRMLEGFALLLRSPIFFGYAFNAAFSLSAFFAFATAAPYVMVNVMGRPVTEYGLYFVIISLAFIAGSFVSARMSPEIGMDRMILLGSLIGLISALIAGALLLAGFWEPLAIFIPAAGVVFSNGLAMPNAQAGALGVHPESAGTASSLSGFLQMAIASVFAQAVGTLQGETPYVMIAFMVAGLALSLGSFAAALWFSRQPA